MRGDSSVAPLSATMHVTESFNPEEAAFVAQEFVSSLDNLPGEIQFLLEEIREKDNRINELLHRIQTRHYGLTKHARSVITGAASSSSAPSTPSSSIPFPLPLPPGTPLPTEHLPPNDAKAISKMTTEWGKVEALQEEKVRLAERMERIVNRARERGRAEWVRVGGKDVDEIEKENAKMFGAGGAGTGMMASLGEMGSGEVILGPEGLGRIDRPQKKKRPSAMPLPPSFAGSPIVHPPAASSMPPPPVPSRHNSSTPIVHPPAHHTPSASGASKRTGGGGSGSGRRRHQRTVSSSDVSEIDADGEADGEGEADEAIAGTGEEIEDEGPYCFCGRGSYGEMIGCDNDDCDLEWFHIGCVNLTAPLPKTWYCPRCVEALGLDSSDGTVAGRKKGRKK